MNLLSNIITGASGGSGGKVISIKTGEAYTAMMSGKLKVGTWYRLTDYRTKYYLRNLNNVVHTGNAEQILCFATSKYTFANQCVSETYNDFVELNREEYNFYAYPQSYYETDAWSVGGSYFQGTFNQTYIEYTEPMPVSTSQFFESELFIRDNSTGWSYNAYFDTGNFTEIAPGFLDGGRYMLYENGTGGFIVNYTEFASLYEAQYGTQPDLAALTTNPDWYVYTYITYQQVLDSRKAIICRRYGDTQNNDICFDWRESFTPRWYLTVGTGLSQVSGSWNVGQDYPIAPYQGYAVNDAFSNDISFVPSVTNSSYVLLQFPQDCSGVKITRSYYRQNPGYDCGIVGTSAYGFSRFANANINLDGNTQDITIFGNFNDIVIDGTSNIRNFVVAGPVQVSQIRVLEASQIFDQVTTNNLQGLTIKGNAYMYKCYIGGVVGMTIDRCGFGEIYLRRYYNTSYGNTFKNGNIMMWNLSCSGSQPFNYNTFEGSMFYLATDIGAELAQMQNNNLRIYDGIQLITFTSSGSTFNNNRLTIMGINNVRTGAFNKNVGGLNQLYNCNINFISGNTFSGSTSSISNVTLNNFSDNMLPSNTAGVYSVNVGQPSSSASIYNSVFNSAFSNVTINGTSTQIAQCTFNLVNGFTINSLLNVCKFGELSNVTLNATRTACDTTNIAIQTITLNTAQSGIALALVGPSNTYYKYVAGAGGTVTPTQIT